MQTAIEGLRAARLAHGLSQLDLAAEAGVAPGTVVHLERRAHTPLPSTARKLAKALDTSIPDLFPDLFTDGD